MDEVVAEEDLDTADVAESRFFGFELHAPRNRGRCDFDMALENALAILDGFINVL